MKIHKYFNRISVKIAIIIIVLVVGLFVALDFLVVDRGARTFSDVYRVARSQGALPEDDTPFIFPRQNNGFLFGQPPAGAKLTPPEHFRTRFQASLFLIGLVALLGAFGIGFLTSRIVARPLNKLGNGLKKLRQSHYQQRLDENDSEEFNTLIKEFNGLAEELQRVEELRKNLISDTSHELKTPLAALTAQLEGIEDGVLTLDKERVKILRDQVTRLTEMAEGLQDYAHLRSRVIKPEVKNFRFKEMIYDVVLPLKANLEDKKINVKLNIEDNFALTGDPKLLERAFTNLFDNTIRYSQASVITISATPQEIIFTDDGVGVPAQHLQDIFERFFRLEKSRNRTTGGLGLGLSIIREIIEAHGWKILARQPIAKKGIEFVIETGKQQTI
jgi:two-component system, OmpR family, sensor histidine kinase BaeS